MLLERGDVVLVAHRRLFQGDEPRYFIGEVLGYDAGVVKLSGRSYARDLVSGELVGKAEERTKLVALASGTVLVYQLPRSVMRERLTFHNEDGETWLQDGEGFRMNLTEEPRGGRM
jgi:hypothetical protein